MHWQGENYARIYQLAPLRRKLGGNFCLPQPYFAEVSAHESQVRKPKPNQFPQSVISNTSLREHGDQPRYTRKSAPQLTAGVRRTP